VDAETIHNHSRDYPIYTGHFGLDPKLLSLQHHLHRVYVLQSCAAPGFGYTGPGMQVPVEDVERIGGAKALQSCRVLRASKAGRAAAGYRPGRGVYQPGISSWYAQQERRQRSNTGTYHQVCYLLQVENVMHCKAKA